MRKSDTIFENRYNSILGTGCGHSFAAGYAKPSHHFAQESPQPWNLINLINHVANACHMPFRFHVREIGKGDCDYVLPRVNAHFSAVARR